MKNLSLLSGLIFAMLLLFSACSVDDDVDPDIDDTIEKVAESSYLIFGHFYGRMPNEEGIEIFKIEDGKLYEDTNDNYPNSEKFYIANFIELPDEKYLEVNDLMDSFPLDILKDSERVIGMPDAGDWGGLYVEYYTEGEEAKFWLIDILEANIPENIKPFVEEVKEKIKIINAD